MAETVEAPARTAAGAPPDAAARLLAEIGEMLRELRGGATVVPPALDDELEQALGIDSLARMELMLRLEQAFAAQLPQALVEQARTPRDLLRALAAATPRSAAVPRRAAPPPAASVADALPRHAQTMLEVLQWYAAQGAGRAHLRLLDDAPDAPWTVARLLARAEAVAGGLQRHGVVPGDAVALMLPTGIGFFEAFAGIWRAGAVPVPIYPPLRPAQLEDHLRRQAQILANADAVLLITDAAARPAARILQAGAARLRAVLDVEALRGPGERAEPVAVAAGDIALLQYTSGSTGQPKGVVLTHANLLANIRAMGEALQVDARDVFVSWLPLYHDMGLIGAWMGSLYHGIELCLMSPQSFLARPSRWLRAIHEHGGTLSAAPNFAYELLAGRLPDDELQGLDLSRWRCALNGAEPVQATTLRRVAERLRRQGLDPRALLPVYGLAECGVGLSFTPLGRGPRVDRVDRRALQRDGRAVPAPDGQDADRAGDSLALVGCGLPLPGHEIRIVDGHGHEQPERVEGRVEFRGPSATAGYFHSPQATRALFDGDWLDTGDVGYVADGELFLSSRAKDLIIRGGHNLHPYALEQAVGELPGVRKGCVAVFGAADPAGGTERVVVVAETRLSEPSARRALHARIAELALAQLGLPADDIVLAGAHRIAKTSSGKIRRAECRTLYEQGRLDAGSRPLAWQLARLWADALRRRLDRPLQRAAGALDAAWLWGLFGLGATAGLAVALWPVPAARRRAVRAIAGAVLRASRLPLQVDGAEHLGDGARPAVLVVNHQSYADWLLLSAVVPPGTAFVAKRELARWAPLRWLLTRMGTHFVTRDDVHDSVADARELLAAVRAGESLLVFVEGSLSRAPGLRGFRMGAFMTAAQAGVPLVPVSLRGARSLLRAGSWRPHRHPVRIRIDAPLLPRAGGWREALRLRDAARERIGAGCGEPVLPQRG